ncbi:MAG: septum formation protein Maf [Bacteroidales bacterium]|nr:septum formation protein Maf [Bacteroidales bacterium]
MVLEEINRHRIILASRSPRRKQLLEELGIRFDVISHDWNEEYPDGLAGAEIAVHLAEVKAETFRDRIQGDEIIITADTIVWCNNRVLGKPVDEKEAIEIISEISGNTHEVITGVCLLSKRGLRSFYSTTKVTFESLNPEEIEFYVRKYRPYDKAGAYGIQEWIGLAACSHIEGSYFNVMGLPAEKLYHELQLLVADAND